jgi:nucleotide-binding universal stress UspA family protein
MTGTTDEIIVGYDGSPGSELALNWAAREASKRGSRLTVCHAWALGDLALPAEPAAFDVLRWHGEEIVNQGLRRAEAIAGPEGVQPLLVLGSPARVLCEHSDTAMMVVVGARGDGGLAGLLLGSVAWQLAGHGQGRIVIVRGSGRRANAAPGPVVAGVDGSAASRAVLAFASEEAALRRVPLIAACALTDAPGRIGGAGRLEEEFSSLVTSWEKEHPGVPVLRQVTHGTPRAVLLDAAAEAQLLIVGSRGRGGIRGMTLGSVATVLAHHAPCPVGIVRQPAALSPEGTEARQRTISTGRSARWMTLCAVLPMTSPARSPRPREPMTMTPQSSSMASATISRAAWPYMVFRTRPCALTPAWVRVSMEAATSA